MQPSKPGLSCPLIHFLLQERVCDGERAPAMGGCTNDALVRNCFLFPPNLTHSDKKGKQEKKMARRDWRNPKWGWLISVTTDVTPGSPYVTTNTPRFTTTEVLLSLIPHTSNCFLRNSPDKTFDFVGLSIVSAVGPIYSRIMDLASFRKEKMKA